MTEHPLVSLAAAMRTALAAPMQVITNDKEAQTARLDLIDMIPDLERALIGEQAVIRNMTWSVKAPMSLFDSSRTFSYRSF